MFKEFLKLFRLGESTVSKEEQKSLVDVSKIVQTSRLKVQKRDTRTGGSFGKCHNTPEGYDPSILKGPGQKGGIVKRDSK